MYFITAMPHRMPYSDPEGKNLKQNKTPSKPVSNETDVISMYVRTLVVSLHILYSPKKYYSKRRDIYGNERCFI